MSASTPKTPSAASKSDTAAPLDPGLTWRSFLIAVVCTVLAGLWVKQAEIVVLATQISEAVPAIPGLAALILVFAGNALWKRFSGRSGLSRGELICIFLFVTIANTVSGVGVQRFLIALITAPFYFKQGGIPEAQRHLPEWVVPHDTETIRRLYEGSPDGRVPWDEWMVPALIWTGFFLALWVTMYCLMALLYRAWSEEEKLSFPLVFLPTEIVSEGAGAFANFFRNPWMWAGFAFSGGYNLLNILHALQPSFPAVGKFYDLSPAFPDAPWSAVAPIRWHFRPELIGMGYLVSTEISLTVWLSFVAMKLAAVAAAAMGYPQGAMPYAKEQGIGCYLVLGVLILYLARRHLLRTLRMAINGVSHEGSEGISYRTAWLGLLLGFTAVVGLCWLMGLALWVALLFLTVVLVVAMVIGRIRGEAGVPLIWLFPFYMQKNVLLYTLGSHAFLASGDHTLSVFAMLTFLSRGYFPAMIGYQIEGMEFSRRLRIRPSALAWTGVLAVVIGFAVGWWMHLTPYYQHGAQQLRGGIWGSGMARQEYQWAAQFVDTPRLPEPARINATVVGGATTLALAMMRLTFARFPLHPLGYAITCSYDALVWGPFMLVWLLKALALRYGGMMFYRKTIPAFLGLALGHYAVAGIFWGLLGVWTGEAVKGYPVFFG